MSEENILACVWGRSFYFNVYLKDNICLKFWNNLKWTSILNDFTSFPFNTWLEFPSMNIWLSTGAESFRLTEMSEDILADLHYSTLQLLGWRSLEMYPDYHDRTHLFYLCWLAFCLQMPETMLFCSRFKPAATKLSMRWRIAITYLH